MKAYYVEGLFEIHQANKRSNPNAKGGQAQLEPFAKIIWAESPEEAVKIATQELKGGQWVQEPRVSQTSDAQRMRVMGAPELPGLAELKRNVKKAKI